MALCEAEISIELREILLKDRPKALYKISSKGTVPVLQINSETIIDESLDIMIWVINKSKINWLEHEKTKQFEMIRVNDTDFKYWLDRYKYSDRYPDKTHENYQKKCGEFLSSYNSILKNKIYLFGEQYQLVDIALFPFIRQCAHINSNWFENNFKNLNTWLNKIKSSSLFLSIMNKYNLWDKEGRGEIVEFKR